MKKDILEGLKEIENLKIEKSEKISSRTSKTNEMKEQLKKLQQQKEMEMDGKLKQIKQKEIDDLKINLSEEEISIAQEKNEISAKVEQVKTNLIKKIEKLAPKYETREEYEKTKKKHEEQIAKLKEQEEEYIKNAKEAKNSYTTYGTSHAEFNIKDFASIQAGLDKEKSNTRAAEEIHRKIEEENKEFNEIIIIEDNKKEYEDMQYLLTKMYGLNYDTMSGYDFSKYLVQKQEENTLEKNEEEIKQINPKTETQSIEIPVEPKKDEKIFKSIDESINKDNNLPVATEEKQSIWKKIKNAYGNVLNFFKEKINKIKENKTEIIEHEKVNNDSYKNSAFRDGISVSNKEEKMEYKQYGNYYEKLNKKYEKKYYDQKNEEELFKTPEGYDIYKENDSEER